MPEQVIITKEAYVALTTVLLEFVVRADAGEAAKRAYTRFVESVLEANPELRSEFEQHN